MKVKNLFLLIVSIIILIANASFTEALTLKVDPSQKVLPDVGTTFEINIKIEEVSDLGGFELDLVYPPAIVTIESASDVSLGDFLGSTGRSASALGPDIDNTTGTLTFGGFSFGDDAGASGSGDLVTIIFTVQSRQDGTLDLQTATVTDTEASEMTVDSLVDGSLERQSIQVSPDPMHRSRWILLPEFMSITGEGTSFSESSSVIFSPDSAVLALLPPSVESTEQISQIIFVMPSWLTGIWDVNETVTVTVTTGSDVVSDTFEIEMLPLILGE